MAVPCSYSLNISAAELTQCAPVVVAIVHREHAHSSALSGECHLTLSHAAATVTYTCASKWVLMSILQKSCVQKVPISYYYILGW